MKSIPHSPRTRAELAAENALLRQVLRETPAGLAASVGPEHLFTYFNSRFQANAGGRAQVGRSIADCLPELVGQGIVAIFDEVYRSGQTFTQLETPVDVLDPVTHRLEAYYYDFTFKPLRNARGQVDGLVVFGVDATAQVRDRLAAEQALNQQREFYETLLREVPAGIVAFDAEHRYLWANPLTHLHADYDAWMLGKTSAEACALRGYGAVVSAERDRRFAQALREHREVTWEETVPSPEGPRHWLRRMRPVFGPDGNFRIMVASGLDATEHRRAEARVHEQQALTQHLLDLVPNPIRLSTANGRLLFRNTAQVEIARRTTQRLRQYARDPRQVPELQLTRARLQQVLDTGQEAQFDIAFQLDSGEVRDYQVVMRPLPQPDGTTHVLTVSTDVTDLKQAQRGATQAAKAQEIFLATMSHEIRTPLNGVLGMAGLLAKTPLDPEQQRYLDVVRHSGRYLLAILNDVLDMAKIRAGRLQLETVPVDLAQALRQTAETLAWQAHEKGLTLALEVFEQPLPVVQTDPVRLNQVLLNLLGNAIKFTDLGRVTLHAAVRAETADALTVHFSVQDTGPGLSPQVQEHVFDAFAQASSDTTRHYGGTGLGLAISSLLVQQLGGHLVVCSEPDHGSTFSFILALPKAPLPPAHLPQAAKPEVTALHGWRVLLVDDNALNLELATAVLRQNGVTVDAAASGHAAVALFAAHAYHAVLMDVHMPGMNGLEATARIRQHPDPARAATPVLAMTADAFSAQHERYRAASMNDVLTKPFTESELLAKLLAVGVVPAPESGPA